VTVSENFVARWARLKHKSDSRCGTEPAADPVVAQPPGGAAADEPFDAVSLPSIEAITVSTDIRGFLQSRVPAELTRAALRQAWASDPAIRDFIGIAENQWDFSDPNAIPGFGPLLERDNVPALLGQALGSRGNLAEMIPEMQVSMEQSLPAAIEPGPAAVDPGVQPAFDGSRPTGDISGLPGDRGAETAAASSNDDGAAEQDDSPRHRLHGSALPR
jgi:hypothetical protein